MCGIAGVFDSRHDATARECAERMVSAMPHRGPDGRGFASVRQANGRHVVVGHSRLSIIDLTDTGRQPLTHAPTGCIVTYNGEIYNHRTLRSELESLGHHFVGTSDTEVLLHGYVEWGEEVLERLSGMYAFALWDARDQSILLARDPLGVKPLYITVCEGAGYFASELRALLQIAEVSSELDPTAVRHYLAFGAPLAPHTIIRSIQSILPGECLRIRGREISRRRYWDPVRIALRPPRWGTYPEAVAATREALAASVRRHLVSDVPVAAFLSGGVDSSVVTAVAKSLPEGSDIETYSLFFPGSGYDESRHVQAVAKHLRVRNHSLLITGREVSQNLTAAQDAIDQPSLDGINTYFISRFIHERGIKVGLSGTGGDELFGGYPSFSRIKMAYLAGALVPSPLRRLGALGLERILAGHPSRRKLAEYLSSQVQISQYYAVTRRLFSLPEIGALSRADVSDDWLFPAHLVAELPERPHYVEDSVSLMELQLYMQNVLLRDIDCASMASSVEVRVPLLDVQLVETALSCPGWMKRPQRTPKPLLLDACGDLLPRGLFERGKMGFTVPISDMMRSILRDGIQEAFEDNGVLAMAGLEPAAVRREWCIFKARATTEGWARIWSLYSLVRWVKRNIVARPAALGHGIPSAPLGA